MKHKIRSGFTLVELLIVIIIVSILATIAVPKCDTAWRSSTESRLRDNLREYRVAIERFHNDTGLYPNSLADARKNAAPATGLDATGATISIPPGSWQGPYILGVASGNNRYPTLRGVGFTYGILAPDVGKLTVNSTRKDLNGIRYDSW